MKVTQSNGLDPRVEGEEHSDGKYISSEDDANHCCADYL